MEAKQKIRKNFLKIRKEINSDVVENNSRIICEKLICMDIWNNVSSIFVYSSINNEVNLDILVKWARCRGIIIAFPKVTGNDMNFYQINNENDLKKGYFDILEPLGNTNIIEPDVNSLIFVPGIAFDKRGYRVGYGKGFYDRFFERYYVGGKIGVAFESQMTEEIINDKYDIAMDIIVNEKGEVVLNDKFRGVM